MILFVKEIYITSIIIRDLIQPSSNNLIITPKLLFMSKNYGMEID